MIELIQGLLLAFAFIVILMAAVHPPPARRRASASRSGAKVPRPTTSRKAPRRWAASCSSRSSSRIYLLPAASPTRRPSPRWRRCARVGGLGAFDDYLNARTGEGIRARQKLIWLTVVAVRRGLADPADLCHHGHRRAVRRRGPDRPVAVHRCSRPSRSSPRPTASTSPTASTAWPAGRSPSRSSRSCSSRCSTCPSQAEPRPAVCADHRRPAWVPVVQRPPGPDLHRRRRGAGPRGDPRRHRAHHRPDPGPAADRDHLRRRDAVGDPPGRLLQADRRQAALPHEPAPPPLRAGWLGRGEDHDPLLDRRHPRGAARA